LEENQKELDRLKPFESEVKEKSALLGKTRHEGSLPSPSQLMTAVILNEHLTKALRLLKRASPSSTVDKQVITNFLVQFLSLPREDTKRYEILNLISSLLEWNDEQRQKAGLARTTNVRRINSNPMLSEFPLSPDRKEVFPI
jgi:GRAB domain